MEKIADNLEVYLEKQLELYTALETVFAQEKKQLVDMDVDGLWKTVATKKQIVSQLTQLNTDMTVLVRKYGWQAKGETDVFNLSQLIKRLPVSQMVKKHLKQIKLGVEHCKEKVHSAAQANKQYVQESLVVINDIFSQTHRVKAEQKYNYSGQILESNTSGLINTEV